MHSRFYIHREQAHLNLYDTAARVYRCLQCDDRWLKTRHDRSVEGVAIPDSLILLLGVHVLPV